MKLMKNLKKMKLPKKAMLLIVVVVLVIGYILKIRKEKMIKSNYNLKKCGINGKDMALEYLKSNKLGFAEKVVNTKNLQIREDNDYILVECDGEPFLIKDEDVGKYCGIMETFISDHLVSLNNLELLSFTTRYPQDTSYKFIKSIPSNLKVLHIDHSDGLDFEVLPKNLSLFVNITTDEQDKSIDTDNYEYYEDYVKQIDIGSKRVSKVIDDSVFLRNYLLKYRKCS